MVSENHLASITSNVSFLSSFLMTLFQYPQIPYLVVHSADIVLLLSIGAIYELLLRLYKHSKERRTPHERKINVHLATLKYEAARKRALGPSAFVETSKLERAVLATEKELTKITNERGARTAVAAKRVKTCNLICNVIVLLTYWGVAMVAIDGSRIEDASGEYELNEMTDDERAAAFWKGFLFPLSYHGLGYKISQYGIDSEKRASCVGALAVFWSARVTTGEIVDCVLQWWAR
jgi:hypothetical protein